MPHVTVDGGQYIVSFRYDRVTVDLLKSRIPSANRSWDASKKIWLVSAQYKDELANIFSENVPEIHTGRAVQKDVLKVLDVRYIGIAKDRGDGVPSAFGYSQGKWGVLFTEKVLREWFEGFSNSDAPKKSSYYSVLGVTHKATQGEIKKGYRRMARQWHPDVCKEQNAHDVFLKIGEAYEILSNAGKRARYDVGLTLEKQQKPDDKIPMFSNGYRSPLRCGILLLEGYDELNRFFVTKINGWEDIIKGDKVLVTSWQQGDKHFTENWV